MEQIQTKKKPVGLFQMVTVRVKSPNIKLRDARNQSSESEQFFWKAIKGHIFRCQNKRCQNTNTGGLLPSKYWLVLVGDCSFAKIHLYYFCGYEPAVIDSQKRI